MLTSSTQMQNRLFHVIERTRTSAKSPRMKNARARRAKLLFFVVKYANWLPKGTHCTSSPSISLSKTKGQFRTKAKRRLITTQFVTRKRKVSGIMQRFRSWITKEATLRRTTDMKYPRSSITALNESFLEWLKRDLGSMLRYRPFYTFLLSCLAFEWKWGWRWPCFDRDLPAFLMLMLFSC